MVAAHTFFRFVPATSEDPRPGDAAKSVAGPVAPSVRSVVMDTEPPVLSRRGETITLDPDTVGDVHRHSAFSVWDDVDDVPDGVDPRTQLHVGSDQVPVHRSDLDDVARAETEALVSLGAAIDHACLTHLTSLVEVEDVAADALADWLVAATAAVTEATAPTCTPNAYLDTLLRRHARLGSTGDGLARRRVVDAGWCEADVLLVARREPPFHAVVAEEHLAALRGYLQVTLTSVDFGTGEFLQARAASS
jgi:hypothetical protein